MMSNPHKNKRSPRLPVKGKKFGGSARKKDRFFPLQALADLLNTIPNPQQTEGLDPHLPVFVEMVRHAVYSVPMSEGAKILVYGTDPPRQKLRLAPPFLGLAARAFNRLARDFPAPLQLSRGRDVRGRRVWIPTVETSDTVRLLLWMAWKYLFGQRGWERLRQCLNCRTWFVDRGRNKQARWCSRACTNRWWTRDRRRQIGGKRSRKRARAPQPKARAGHARKES